MFFSTFAICDKEQTCTAVTVYNFSDAFAVLIGDTVAITEPFVCDSTVSARNFGVGQVRTTSKDTASHNPPPLQEVPAVSTDGKEQLLSFQSVRVQNPGQLVRNRKRLGQAHVAFAVARLDGY